MNFALLISLVATLIATISFGSTFIRNKNKDVELISDRLARLETKVEVFWKNVSFDAARVLHSPHPEFARRDELLEKFTAEELSISEAIELEKMLNEVLNQHNIETGQRMAAALLLRYLNEWYRAAEHGEGLK